MKTEKELVQYILEQKPENTELLYGYYRNGKKRYMGFFKFQEGKERISKYSFNKCFSRLSGFTKYTDKNWSSLKVLDFTEKFFEIVVEKS